MYIIFVRQCFELLYFEVPDNIHWCRVCCYHFDRTVSTSVAGSYTTTSINVRTECQFLQKGTFRWKERLSDVTIHRSSTYIYCNSEWYHLRYRSQLPRFRTGPVIEGFNVTEVGRYEQPTRCNKFRLLIFLNQLYVFQATDSPNLRSTIWLYIQLLVQCTDITAGRQQYRCIVVRST